MQATSSFSMLHERSWEWPRDEARLSSQVKEGRETSSDGRGESNVKYKLGTQAPQRLCLFAIFHHGTCNSDNNDTNII